MTTTSTTEFARFTTKLADGTTKEMALAYETFGDRSNPALVLIMGLGGQLIAWPEEFCTRLSDKGFFVIRYDNRDIGLSTSFDDVFDAKKIEESNAKLGQLWVSGAFGELPNVPAPYHLSDMANDCIALLDELKIQKAHVAGASMGGMIIQTLLIEHPSRILSAVPIMTATGEHDLGAAAAPNPESMKALVDVFAVRMKGDLTREETVQLGIKAMKAMSGPLFDEEEARAKEEKYIDRAYRPFGIGRQMLAVRTSLPRRESLKRASENPDFNIPTVVVHGKVDPLVPLACGEDVAKAIKGSRLVVIDQMGHDLPKALWGELIDAIYSAAK